MAGYSADSCPQCSAPVPPEAAERVTCAFCGASLVRLGAGGQGAEASRAWGAHLRMVVCVDQQGTGIEAFRLLIPAGWQFQGGVFWTMTNPGMPAVASFRAFNPQGLEAVEIFPNIMFNWSNDPIARMMFPEGSQYYGSEVRRPMPAVEALANLIVPRYRGNVPGARILEAVPLAQSDNAFQGAVTQGQAGPSDAARVRLSYALNGQPVVEDVYGVVEVSRMTAPGMYGPVEMVYWTADYLYSFRAAADRFDRVTGQFQSIVRSFKLNMDWYARYTQISQQMIQGNIQHIHQIGQASRYYAQASNQASDMIAGSYWDRQKTLDRISSQFSQSIRGVDEYFDPSKGYGVELPGGYNHAWTNALGEYIVTDDSFFNPNIGSSQNWEQMKRTP
jgi:hypothetical protein